MYSGIPGRSNRGRISPRDLDDPTPVTMKVAGNEDVVWSLLPTGSEERGVLGFGSIPVAIFLLVNI